MCYNNLGDSVKIDVLSYQYIESLIDLLSKCFPEVDIDNNRIDKIVNNNNMISLVGIKDNVVIANAILTLKFDYIKNKKIFYLDYFCVSPDERNQGYGTMLFNYISELAKKMNVDYMTFTSNDARVFAHKLYLKNGCQLKPTSVFVKQF